MIVTFDDKVTPNWEIPFPAVTICPELLANVDKLNVTHLYNYLNNNFPPYKNITDDT